MAFYKAAHLFRHGLDVLFYFHLTFVYLFTVHTFVNQYMIYFSSFMYCRPFSVKGDIRLIGIFMAAKISPVTRNSLCIDG